MEMETVAEGLLFPEGPVALGDGSVLIVELRRQTLSRVTPDGKVSVVATLGGAPNGVAIGPDGAAYVCNNGGFKWLDRPDGITTTNGTPDEYRGGSIQRVDIATGEWTTLYDNFEGVPLNGPNDLAFDRNGGFWFTDHGKVRDSGRDHGALYYARADGSRIVKAKERMLTPNGVGLSPDESEVYVAETQTGRLWAFEIIGEGRLKEPETMLPGRLLVTMPDFQLFDSLAMQADGTICVGTLVRGGITSVHPATGAVSQVSIPLDPYITNLCFGGPDMRDVWITGSGRGRLFRGRWPEPGLKLPFNA